MQHQIILVKKVYSVNAINKPSTFRSFLTTALFTHELFNNVDRPTSPNAPHLERFDVRAVYM